MEEGEEEEAYRSRFHGRGRQAQQKGGGFVGGDESEVTERFGKPRGNAKGVPAERLRRVVEVETVRV